MCGVHTVITRVTLALATLPATAQQPAPAAAANPAPGCTATPAQLEANKGAAMQILSRCRATRRVALADPSYKQHNPAFKKRARGREVGRGDPWSR